MVQIQNSAAKKLLHIILVYGYNRLSLLTKVILRLGMSPEWNAGVLPSRHPGQLNSELILFK